MFEVILAWTVADATDMGIFVAVLLLPNWRVTITPVSRTELSTLPTITGSPVLLSRRAPESDTYTATCTHMTASPA